MALWKAYPKTASLVEVVASCAVCFLPNLLCDAVLHPYSGGYLLQGCVWGGVRNYPHLAVPITRTVMYEGLLWALWGFRVEITIAAVVRMGLAMIARNCRR